MGSLSRFNLNDAIKKYNLKTFIETGTGVGDSLFYAAKHSFNHFYSIELNHQLKFKALILRFHILTMEMRSLYTPTHQKLEAIILICHSIRTLKK